MRLRNAVLALASAAALVLTVPMSASAAAAGEFSYKYGRGLPGFLVDPPSGECIDALGALADDPAFAPYNHTTSTATVFLDFGCSGETYYVMDPGKKLGDRLKFRSVIFS
ncbi:hypothetical protein [Kitasatospora sp. NPDC089509]|uniref:hypothetical protein n=1 Tax=Kitasatospora sp. NPDC089509 TaxID=3364079 RepID=UPI003808A092